MHDIFVDEKEVALITGFRLATLRNHRSLNKGIPFYKVGRSVRYWLPDVHAFMRAHRIETDQAA